MTSGTAGRTDDISAAGGPDVVFRALADPQRRQMLKLVRDGELAAGQIAGHFDITQQAVSQHLRVLTSAGLLTERRQGTRRLFLLRPEALEPVGDVLDDLWPIALVRLKQVVEEHKNPKGSDA